MNWNKGSLKQTIERFEGITTEMFPTEHLASITPYINNLDRGHRNYVHFTHIFPILIIIFLKLRLGYIGRLNQSRFSLIGVTLRRKIDLRMYFKCISVQTVFGRLALLGCPLSIGQLIKAGALLCSTSAPI